MQDINEAVTAKAMIAWVEKVIVVADPSKFNRRGIAHMAAFSQFIMVSPRPPDGP